NLLGRNKDEEELSNTKRDIEELYRRSLKRRDTNEGKHNSKKTKKYKKYKKDKKDIAVNKDKVNPKKDRDSQKLTYPNLKSRKNQGRSDTSDIQESYGIDYRKTQPLKITNNQGWDSRNDISDIIDIDFEFRKNNFKFNKHDSKKTQKEKHHGDKEKTQEPGHIHSEYIYDNGRDDLRYFEKHHDDNDNGNDSSNNNDSNYRQLKSIGIKGNRELITRDDIEDVEDFEFRKATNQPFRKVSDNFKDIEGSHNFNFHNDQSESFERESNSVDNLNDIINVSYCKKTNNDKQQNRPKEDNNKDGKDKQHDKPSKKDNNRGTHAVKNDEIVGYTRRDMEDIYP
ncbi:hypothetical protein K502DRAFT_360159, partial [Neoconidiobolus thromboides FSU 785]